MSAMTSAAQAMENAVRSAMNGVIDALNSAISLFNSSIGQLTGKIGQVGQLTAGGTTAGAGNTFDTANGVAPYKAPTNLPMTSGHGSNAAQIAGALEGQGFSKVAIAGILSNLGAESGGQTLSGISTTAVNPTSGAYGIAQWLGDRKTNEASYAAIHHEAPSSLAAQVGYLVQELRTGYHSTFVEIQNAKSPQQAAMLFETMFEKAGAGAVANHQTLAAQAYAMLGGSSGGGGSGGGGGGSGSSSAAINALMNPAAAGGKAIMRYVNHKPVGVMTEAEWQAYQAAHPTSVRSLLYANPFPGGAQQGRTDMGVDFSATPGSAVDAIGAGVVTAIIKNWYKGQPLIEERLTSGPNKGQYVYYAEQIKSLVNIGQQVKAGQRIGTVAQQGTGLELGFGAAGGKTLAQATTGYHEGQVTPAGQAFAQFLKSIGSGTYTSTSGGITTGGGTNFGAIAAQAIQTFIANLQKAANALITTYQNLEQSGTVKTLTKALGVGTGGGTSTKLDKAIERLPAAATFHQIDMALGKITSPIAARSPQEQAAGTLVAEFRGSGLMTLAKELKSQWVAAIATLSQELYAEQVLKDGELLNLQATQMRDQTTLQQNADAAALTVVKAVQQKQNDALSAQVTSVRDMTQIVTDRLAAMAQRVEDSMQQAADAAAGVVSGINDQTQIQVDVLGERGLYGLNLVAQKLQVQADETKAFWDQQINIAKLNVDTVTAQLHTQIQTAQLNLNQITVLQDQRVALAQQSDDTVRIVQLGRIAAAQAHADAVTLHFDTSVVGPAQIAVDMNATAPKAQQDVYAAILRKATGQAGIGEGKAGAALEKTTANANEIIGGADEALAETTTKAGIAIGKAQQTVATITGNATLAIAGANAAYQGVTDAASIAEAIATGAVSVAGATASTQFAGTGTTVNVYGVPTENAAAIADAISWVARTQLY
jgi:murein DD-endopeptidase MepM/ murein hydrolase activator NlpD